MSLATRTARAVPRSLRGSRLRQPQRRNASSEEYHPSSEKALHLPNANSSGSESFGLGFYTSLAAIPIFYLGYSLSTSSSDNYINKLYQQYKEGSADSWRRDVIHEAAVKQALADRAAMSSHPRDTAGPVLRYPEQLNQGSPYNIAAGQGTADLSQLEQWYHARNAEAEQERLSRLRDGKVVSVYDAESPTIYDAPHSSGFARNKSGSG